MIPANSLAGPRPAEFLYPQSPSPLVDYEQGGVALRDPSQGLMFQLWTGSYDGDQVVLSSENGHVEVAFQRAGLIELSLAFDSNMNPFVAFTDAGGSGFWWYNFANQQQEFSPYIPDIRNLRCTLDDPRPLSANSRDIILAYLKDDALCYRQQRDEYAIERVLESGLAENSRLLSLGMNRENRLQFRLVP